MTRRRLDLIGTVALLPCLLAATPLRARATAETGFPVRFQLQVQGEASSPPSGELWLRPLARPDQRFVFPVESAAVEAVLPTPGDWELALILDGFWAAREVFSVPDDRGQPVLQSVEVWPTGRITGSFRLDDVDAAPPRRLEAHFETPAVSENRKRGPSGTVHCSVGQVGDWSCEVPAGILDLTLRAASYVPRYRWGVRVEPGKAIDLGRLTLVHGASLVGWVEVEEGAFDPDRCRVRLTLLQAPGGQREKARRMQGVSAESKVNERGFFQLGPVAPGSYVLTLEHPGYAPAKLFPVDLWPGSETVLKAPLLLKRPIELEVQLDPPNDWLGQPWQLQILRASDNSAGFDQAPVFSGPVPHQGRLSVEGQAPGTFWVRVLDSPGNRIFSDTDWVVEGPEDAERLITIDLVSISGGIELGDEPLEAFLAFGGENGAVRVELASDAEGAYEGILPRGGTWRVDILAVDGSLKTYAEVEVLPDEGGHAEVDIHLPDTHLTGKVVDTEGRGVAGASVWVAGAHGEASLDTDGTGSFELRGAPEGPTQLRARLGLRDQVLTSDRTLVHLLDGQTTGPVVLSLEANKPVTGRVVSELGPVAGAVVDLVALDPPLPFGTSVRTGVDAVFSAQVPRQIRSLAAVVSPPGHALGAFVLRAEEEGTALNVAKEGGVLEITTPYTLEEARSRDLAILIAQDGLALPLNTLVRWARGHGARVLSGSQLQIPALAPAQYRVCFTHLQAAGEATATINTHGADGCAEGYLDAGGILQLELPLIDEP